MTAANRSELGHHEQLLLLALNDDRGTMDSSATWYQYGIAGALLSELIESRAITLATEGKKTWVDPAQYRSFEDTLLEAIMAKIRDSKRRTLEDWVSRLATTSKLKHQVAERLCERGVLENRTDRVLLIFNRTVYPTLDPAPERRIVAAISQAVRSDRNAVEDRLRRLIALAEAAEMLPILFDRQELKERSSRIVDLTADDPIASAVQAVITTLKMAAAVVVTT